MNKEQYIKESKEKFDKKMKLVSSIPDSLFLFIHTIFENSIYLDTLPYDDFFKVLRLFAKEFGKYKLNLYYMCSGEYTIAFMYDFSEFSLLMYTKDPAVLDKVSKGKCHISLKKEERGQFTITCDPEVS